MSPRQVVGLVLDEDRRGLLAAKRRCSVIARAATAVARALESGGRVLLVGAGTSGRLAVLEAAECPPTFGTRPWQIQAAMAGGPAALFAASEGAEDREDAGRGAGRRVKRGDLLLAISASSVTPFVRAALSAARARGAHTVLLTCAPGRGLRRLAEIVISIPTGAEVLTGSTRLKAGSATKGVLNAITTAAMVRLGKTYENLMVDLRPRSAKLRDRLHRIVAAAARVPPAHAARLLAGAGGDAKTAIVMGRLGLSASEARHRLRAAQGHVRRALALRRAARCRAPTATRTGRVATGQPHRRSHPSAHQPRT